MYNYTDIDSKEPLHYDFLDDLRLVHASLEMPFGGETHLFHPSPHVRMVFLSSGACIATHEKRKHILHTHDVFFLYPGERYRFAFTAGRNELYWIEMRGRRVRELLHMLGLSPAKPMLHGVSNPNFFQLVRRMKSAYSNISLPDFLLMKSCLFHLCAILLSDFSSDGWSRVPHTNPAIRYVGRFAPWPSAASVSQGFYGTSQVHDYVEYSFSGSGVKWYGTMNRDCGIADVLVDGEYSVSVDLFSEERLGRQLLFSQNRLREGDHVIKIVCTGRKNHLSAGHDINVEAFEARKDQALPQPSSKANSRMVNQAISFFHENYGEDISISHLATMLGVSRTFFSTTFKTETGSTPTEYLSAIRMKRAKEHLRLSAHSIMDVAKLCGYKDVSYFMKRFKQCEGITPSEYRASHRHGAPEGAETL